MHHNRALRHKRPALAEQSVWVQKTITATAGAKTDQVGLTVASMPNAPTNLGFNRTKKASTASSGRATSVAVWGHRLRSRI